MRGTSHKLKQYRILSYDSQSAAKGMYQIYLDTLKDDKTRQLDIGQKKKLMYYLFMLFHESLIELPFSILGNYYLTKVCPVLHNAQTYFLIKESMRDMHELVAFKDMLPRRYFVMHNAMYYARDMFLADITAEIKLNPLINIPEFQKFRNLDIKEMMSHRWSQCGTGITRNSSVTQCQILLKWRQISIFQSNYPQIFMPVCIPSVLTSPTGGC